MDILEIALIIFITLVIDGLTTILVLKYYLWQLKLGPVLRMGKAWAGQMGTKSQQVQHAAKMKVMQTEAKAKVAKAAVEALPMGGILGKIIDKAGISPEEIFALLQDQDFIKGIKVLLDTFGGIKDAILKKEKPEESQFSQFNY